MIDALSITSVLKVHSQRKNIRQIHSKYFHRFFYLESINKPLLLFNIIYFYYVFFKILMRKTLQNTATSITITVKIQPLCNINILNNIPISLAGNNFFAKKTSINSSFNKSKQL